MRYLSISFSSLPLHHYRQSAKLNLRQIDFPGKLLRKSEKRGSFHVIFLFDNGGNGLKRARKLQKDLHINGYLEAILDTGATTIQEHNPAQVNERGGHFNPTKYFVEEVVTGVDESDLYPTWIKVVATRNTRERSSRLENMCWRILHLTRKMKHVLLSPLESEENKRLAKRRREREQGLRDVTEQMSEDLSGGEKGDITGEMVQCETPRQRFQRNFSILEVWSDDKKEKKLYIVLISLHGLVRGENMELGRDSDTGGQVKYVVELARALAKMPGVYRVDLFTRQICSPEVDWSYGEPTEMLTAEIEVTYDRGRGILSVSLIAAVAKNSYLQFSLRRN
ncbi:hypothetical protein SLEP1_g44175 [Rubroshorea leprosula]|uniref:Sucrose-phosphate synthase n=1 Tax=Rubroshorea leprosula TaxID=152421 RepID=A0AAV5LG35_9ROSI|nr:hypothetical protein SLEP1_g44175 [Rubroshorea leprosula]